LGQKRNKIYWREKLSPTREKKKEKISCGGPNVGKKKKIENGKKNKKNNK